MEYHFTSDQWPAIKAKLEQAGITAYERMRMDLADPEAGWQPVPATDVQVTTGIATSDTLIVYGLAKFNEQQRGGRIAAEPRRSGRKADRYYER